MDLRNRKVTLVGMGKTTLAAVRLLLREHAEPFVTDKAPREDVLKAAETLESLGVSYECGGHTDRAFSGAEYVIPSPGVDPRIGPIAEATRDGARILCEMELASRFNRSKVLAVTGTNGKTTTTELLRALVASCGHEVLLAGNNEMPFSAAVLVEPAPEFIVLEVSSYQAELNQTFRPWVAAVLNVTPDHLARHDSMVGYAEAKARLLAMQQESDCAVLNADDPLVETMAALTKASCRRFSLTRRVTQGLWSDGDGIFEGDDQVAASSDILLKGRHNLANVLAALAMMRAGAFDWEGTLEGLRRFRGVEHRIEFVASVNGVDYYNDSKSTNIESLRVALESFDIPVILIAGGRGKGADYRVLLDLVTRRVKRMITIGEDAPLLEEAFADRVRTERAGDLPYAVRRASAVAEPGDIVLLSPACASFDMFTGFEHRGRVFKECVRSLEGGDSR
ncbi:MAG: UDP-N-acetylmuramoyl-L-alanine--D-glutamate ligase [Candidatus Hydrogenedentes bacterium]|nr:UDP-N-acetylmuramoyl-L-alanine--D-glutamate ligase [Candidatus Hydrogenedentota bacterium]